MLMEHKGFFDLSVTSEKSQKSPVREPQWSLLCQMLNVKRPNLHAFTSAVLDRRADSKYKRHYQQRGASPWLGCPFYLLCVSVSIHLCVVQERVYLEEARYLRWERPATATDNLASSWSSVIIFGKKVGSGRESPCRFHPITVNQCRHGLTINQTWRPRWLCNYIISSTN